MSIVELLTQAGLEHIKVQFLPDCIQGCKKIRGGSEVRFVTTELDPGDLINASRNIGVICWIPRDKFPQAKPPSGIVLPTTP